MTLTLGGISTLRAWRPGIVKPLLDSGLSLAQIESTMPMLLVEKSVTHNLVVASGLALAAQLLVDAAPTGLTYHAIGTDTVPPAALDTRLGVEVAREALVQKDAITDTITLTAFYLSGTCAYNIKEAGIFGALATATLNSGTLFAHFLQTYNNASSPSDLSFEYVLELANA